MQTPPDQQKAQNQAEQESRIKYVEELASAEAYPPGDAWISITDAARVTRTSEAMARRWVTSGRLAIKPGDYGIPPRTRLVRLSDVAKIRPIVDPTAAVSDDTRKLDLPSIPRQQAQIMEEHQRLLIEIGTLQITIEQVKSETRAQFQEQLDTLKKQFTLITNVEEQVQTLREELGHQLEEIKGTATTQQGELERQAQALTALQGQLHEAQAAFAASLTASEQAQQARLQQEAARLDAVQAAQGQQLAEIRASLQQAQATLREEAARALAAQAKLQQAALERQAQTFSQALEQQARDFGKDLATLESDQAKDVAMLTSQIESQSVALAQANDAITAAKAAAQDSRAASRAQENRISELQQELEEERSARRELSQQLAALTQRVNTLSSEKGQSTGRERRK
jgi:DNA repair exonuclease SbcCD ATPase subunit